MASVNWLVFVALRHIYRAALIGATLLVSNVEAQRLASNANQEVSAAYAQLNNSERLWVEHNVVAAFRPGSSDNLSRLQATALLAQAHAAGPEIYNAYVASVFGKDEVVPFDNTSYYNLHELPGLEYMPDAYPAILRRTAAKNRSGFSATSAAMGIGTLVQLLGPQGRLVGGAVKGSAYLARSFAGARGSGQRSATPITDEDITSRYALYIGLAIMARDDPYLRDLLRLEDIPIDAPLPPFGIDPEELRDLEEKLGQLSGTLDELLDRLPADMEIDADALESMLVDSIGSIAASGSAGTQAEAEAEWERLGKRVEEFSGFSRLAQYVLGADSDVGKSLQRAEVVVTSAYEIGSILRGPNVSVADIADAFAIMSNLAAFLSGPQETELQAISRQLASIQQMISDLGKYIRREFASVHAQLEGIALGLEQLSAQVEESTKTILQRIETLQTGLARLQGELDQIQYGISQIRLQLHQMEYIRVLSEHSMGRCTGAAGAGQAPVEIEVIVGPVLYTRLCDLVGAVLYGSEDPRVFALQPSSPVDPPATVNPELMPILLERELRLARTTQGQPALVNRHALLRAFVRGLGGLGESRPVHAYIWITHLRGIYEAIVKEPQLALRISDESLREMLFQAEALHQYYFQFSGDWFVEGVDEYLRNIAFLEARIQSLVYREPRQTWMADPALEYEFPVAESNSSQSQQTRFSSEAFICSPPEQLSGCTDAPEGVLDGLPYSRLDDARIAAAGGTIEFAAEFPVSPDTLVRTHPYLVPLIESLNAVLESGHGMLAARLSQFSVVGEPAPNSEQPLRPMRAQIEHLVGDPGSPTTKATLTVFGGISDDGLSQDNVRGTLVLSDQEISLLKYGSTATYTVRLLDPPQAPVTVSITATGEGFAVEPSALTFGPADFDDPQSVAVTLLEPADGSNEEHSSCQDIYERTTIGPIRLPKDLVGAFCNGRVRTPYTANLELILLTVPPNSAYLSPSERLYFSPNQVGGDFESGISGLNKSPFLALDGQVIARNSNFTFNIRSEYGVSNVKGEEFSWRFVDDNLRLVVDDYIEAGQFDLTPVEYGGAVTTLVDMKARQHTIYRQITEILDEVFLGMVAGDRPQSGCTLAGASDGLNTAHLNELRQLASRAVGSFRIIELAVIERFGQGTPQALMVMDWLSQWEPRGLTLLDPCDATLSMEDRSRFHRRGQVLLRDFERADAGFIATVREPRRQALGEPVSGFLACRQATQLEAFEREVFQCLAPRGLQPRLSIDGVDFASEHPWVLEGIGIIDNILAQKFVAEPFDPVGRLSELAESSSIGRLLYSSYIGDLKTVLRLVLGEGVAVTSTYYGYDAAYFAARGGQGAVLVALELLGLPIRESQNPFTGETSLMMAALSGNPLLVRALSTPATVDASSLSFAISHVGNLLGTRPPPSSNLGEKGGLTVNDIAVVYTSMTARKLAAAFGREQVAEMLDDPLLRVYSPIELEPSTREEFFGLVSNQPCEPAPSLDSEDNWQVVDFGSTNDVLSFIISNDSGGLFLVGTCNEYFASRADIFVSLVDEAGTVHFTRTSRDFVVDLEETNGGPTRFVPLAARKAGNGGVVVAYSVEATTRATSLRLVHVDREGTATSLTLEHDGTASIEAVLGSLAEFEVGDGIAHLAFADQSGSRTEFHARSTSLVAQTESQVNLLGTTGECGDAMSVIWSDREVDVRLMQASSFGDRWLCVFTNHPSLWDDMSTYDRSPEIVLALRSDNDSNWHLTHSRLAHYEWADTSFSTTKIEMDDDSALASFQVRHTSRHNQMQDFVLLRSKCGSECGVGEAR